MSPPPWQNLSVRTVTLPRRLARVVERSAAPEAVRLTLAAMADRDSGLFERLEADVTLARRLVQTSAASRSLSRLLIADPGAIEVVAGLEQRTPVDSSSLKALARWKHLELLRIAAGDLSGGDSLEDVGASLAALADDVLGACCTLCDTGDRLAVIGMGKLGGQELNYASDIDVMFVGEGVEEDEARRVMAAARASYRVDANLRPEGRSGPLVRTLSSYRSYWRRWGRAWERQALLKARSVAGGAKLGREFATAAEEQVWGSPFGAEELRQVRDMKARSEGEVARRGLSMAELKRGYGGIRDVEFSVQILQLVHGRHDPALRHRSTLSALGELAAAGYVDPADASDLERAYRFLRTVEHRLQLVEEAQVHTVPAGSEARSQLARVMGCTDSPRASGLEHFDKLLARHQATVRSIHERLFFRPLLESFSYQPAGRATETEAPQMDTATARERLAAFGFRDAERTRAALYELTRGLSRTSRLMEHMLPVLLNWLSETPDPDLGLLGLRNLASSQREVMVRAFRESPEAARRTCLLLGTSKLLAEPLRHSPDLLVTLGDDAKLGPRVREDLVRRAATILRWRRSEGQRQRGLLRMKQDAVVRIAVRDLLDLDEVSDTGTALTELGEAVVEAVLTRLDTSVPIAAVAMGRFGGGELSYASDLDVLLVCGGSSLDEVAAAQDAGSALLRAVNGSTPAERIFAMDAGLRPEGRAGQLVRTLDGYRAYYTRWGQNWERQALVRARPVAGDAELGQGFMKVVEDFVWTRPLGPDDQRDLRRMKARIERERLPANEDPQFHLKLGRGSLSDVEWTAALLQLTHGIAAQGTIDALSALVSAGAMDKVDGDVLAESYRFCERARNRWFLVGAAPGDSLPSQPEQLSRLARSLAMTPAELRSEYRRVTRRARRVVERLFYGMEG